MSRLLPLRSASLVLGFLILFVGLSGTLAAEDIPLAVGAVRNIPAPWTAPVALDPGSGGILRLEAQDPDGRPVEVLVERRSPDGTWQALGTNRTLRGNAEASVDLTVAPGERWRVRPAGATAGPVTLRWRQAAFSGLRDSLKRGLTGGPDTGLPLKKRTELPAGTGGPALAAVPGPGGGLLIAWLGDQGSRAEVWDTALGRAPAPAAQASGAFWDSLALVPRDRGPFLVLGTSGRAEAWAWAGTAWTAEPVPDAAGLETPWGRFSTSRDPEVRVWKEGPLGREDLELPRDPRADRVLLGSTEDGLYVFLASSRDGYRALYSWRPGRGWVSLPVPPAAGPPVPGLWAVTSGAGSLFHLEGRGPKLLLTQFDGNDWRPGLDLSSLAPRGAAAAVLVGPSAWSKTGSLVVVTDRVTVYDLP